MEKINDRVTVRLGELVFEAEEYIEAENITWSELVREAIRFYMDRGKEVEWDRE